jgi:hypothetical protein
MSLDSSVPKVIIVPRKLSMQIVVTDVVITYQQRDMVPMSRHIASPFLYLKIILKI